MCHKSQRLKVQCIKDINMKNLGRGQNLKFSRNGRMNCQKKVYVIMMKKLLLELSESLMQ